MFKSDKGDYVKFKNKTIFFIVVIFAISYALNFLTKNKEEYDNQYQPSRIENIKKEVNKNLSSKTNLVNNITKIQDEGLKMLIKLDEIENDYRVENIAYEELPSSVKKQNLSGKNGMIYNYPMLKIKKERKRIKKAYYLDDLYNGELENRKEELLKKERGLQKKKYETFFKWILGFVFISFLIAISSSYPEKS